jgi:hypothetical protein
VTRRQRPRFSVPACAIGVFGTIGLLHLANTHWRWELPFNAELGIAAGVAFVLAWERPDEPPKRGSIR